MSLRGHRLTVSVALVSLGAALVSAQVPYPRLVNAGQTPGG